MADDSDASYDGAMASDSEHEADEQQRSNKHQKMQRLGQSRPAKNSKSSSEKVKNYEKYARPVPLAVKKMKYIRDKKLKGTLERSNLAFKEAAVAAAKSEILLPSQAGFLEAEGLEKTYKFSQSQLAENVDQNTARKVFSLDLPDYGPYTVHFTRNGRNLLLGGQKGHLAMLDTLRMKLSCEFQADDLVRDVAFLHSNTMFAVAQKKYVFIYDNTGAEAHCIRSMIEPRKLEFLPYHYLLATISGNGVLTYHDVTTGSQVVAHRTKQGLCDSMTQNPWNAVINLGHASGLVTLWTPNMPQAVVKMQCHQGPIRALAVDASGKYLVTAGVDRKVKVFDVRKYQELNEYYLHSGATSLSISQRGLVAMGFGPNVHVVKNAFTSESPRLYMSHQVRGQTIQSVAFQPYEDVLSLGHTNGMSNIVVPGSGEPNFDTFAANPFENAKQRGEGEVRTLIEKLRPEMITLDPRTIGRVDTDPVDEQQSKIEQMARANNQPVKPMKKKMRGRNRLSRRLRKKQQNVIDLQKEKYREVVAGKRKREEREADQHAWAEKASSAPTALNRFFKK